ncbi:MAG: Platelet-activating factor acetylhydrolase plasma/intracellular isoform II [candidate division TM6 bacterium GW2011_GWE2_41_16]|nr:MAG: Platelet-activating factor acetylhydrolase plasma/intracellular isoform II [candidate division TM6 bacterium GW2011_GWE2_41_16]
MYAHIIAKGIAVGLFCIGVCGALFACAIYSSVFDNVEIKPTGSFGVASLTMFEHCLYKGKTIEYPYDVFFPIKKDFTTCPLVLFAHGYLSQSTDYLFLLKELASHGYVVVAINMPGLARVVKLADGTKVHGIFQSIDITKENREQLIKQVIDQYSFMIDDFMSKCSGWSAMQQHFFAGIDTLHVIALGHSLGGVTMLKNASTKKWIKKVISLDGWYENINKSALPSCTWLFLAAGVGGKSYLARMISVDTALAKSVGEKIIIEKAGHGAFSDAILWNKVRRWFMARYILVGSIDAHEGVREIRRIVLDWCSRLHNND